jgi:hypothetical protein
MRRVTLRMHRSEFIDLPAPRQPLYRAQQQPIFNPPCRVQTRNLASRLLSSFPAHRRRLAIALRLQPLFF